MRTLKTIIYSNIHKPYSHFVGSQFTFILKSRQIQNQIGGFIQTKFNFVSNLSSMANMSNNHCEFRFVANVIQASDPRIDIETAIKTTRDLDLQEHNTLLRGLISSCGPEATTRWIGEGGFDEGLTQQWLYLKTYELNEDANQEVIGAAMDDINRHLLCSSFLTSSQSVKLADLCVFWALRNKVNKTMVNSRPALVRWFDHIQHDHVVRKAIGTEFTIVEFNLTSPFETVSSNGMDKMKLVDSDTKSKARKKDVICEEKKADKQSKGEEFKKKASTVPALVSPEQPEVSKLDIRVGVITRCWKHPESTKLFCEEIDVGEGEPRPIASGISAYYESADSLVNRKVLVLCNLKPRNLAGYKSNGMVMCASSEDGTKVELVEPPTSAEVGERVTFGGIEGDYKPFTPAQVAKKKVFEVVAPNLKTDENFHPFWQGPDGKVHKFMTSSGVCFVPSIANGRVS